MNVYFSMVAGYDRIGAWPNFRSLSPAMPAGKGNKVTIKTVMMMLMIEMLCTHTWVNAAVMDAFFLGLLITTSCPSGLHQILILIFKLFNIYQRLFLNFHIFQRHRPSSPHVYFYCDAVTGLCRYMVGSTNIDRGGLTAVWKHCCLNKQRLKTLPSVTGFSTFNQ